MTGHDSGDTERHPCPCDGCDSYALSADEYCVKCIHHGCGRKVRCS
jgi:hypothetical protein